MPRAITSCTLALVALSAACTSYTRLEPAAGAQRLDGDRAVSAVDGVEVQVATEAWPARSEIRRYTTPLRITIDNNSDRPVTLRYQDFALVNPDGRLYSALPPFEIQGEIQERATVRAAPAWGRPAFTYERFYVSPYYAHFYPTLTPFRGRFVYDPFYYDRYYTLWRDVNLPTEEMLQKALPEGVVQPGGRVTGFVYFEPVPRDAQTLEFRFELMDSSDGDVFGAVTIPLTTTTQ